MISFNDINRLNFNKSVLLKYYIDRFGSIEDLIMFLYFSSDRIKLINKINILDNENISHIENLVDFLNSENDLKMNFQKIMSNKFNDFRIKIPKNKLNHFSINP